jgi:hypothetical protein
VRALQRADIARRSNSSDRTVDLLHRGSRGDMGVTVSSAPRQACAPIVAMLERWCGVMAA